MKCRKVLSLLIVVVMMISMMALPVSAAVTFSDLVGYDWAEESIYRWVDAGVLSGYEEGGAKLFKPGNPMKRAELAKVLAVTLNLTEKADAETFTDIDHWAKDYILACAKAGIINGFDQGNGTFKFDPEGLVSREQAIAMLVRAFGMSGSDDEALKKFPDASKVTWSAKEISTILAYNAVEGDSDGTLNPQGQITRAQVAIILDRLVGVYVDADGVISTTSEAQTVKKKVGSIIVVNPAYTGWVDVDVAPDGSIYVETKEYDGYVEPDNAITPCVIANGEVNKVQKGDSYLIEGEGEGATETVYLVQEENSTTKTDGKTMTSKTEYTYDTKRPWNLVERTTYFNGEKDITQTGKYNDKGLLYQRLVNGELTYEYKYDSAGNEIEFLQYNSEGEVTFKVTTEYRTDGQIAKEKEYYMNESGIMTFDFVTEYEYDANGNYTGYTQKNADGIKTFTGKITYDSNGYTASEVLAGYDAEGNVRWMDEYTYLEGIASQASIVTLMITVTRNMNCTQVHTMPMVI